MSEYLLSLFTSAALFGALSLIIYNKDGGERGGLRILFAAALLLPIVNARGSLGELSAALPPYSEESGGEYEMVAEEAFLVGTRRAVCEKFSLSEELVSVAADGFSFRDMRAEKIKITLSGIAALADGRAIEKFVEGEGLGECEVRIRVG